MHADDLLAALAPVLADEEVPGAIVGVDHAGVRSTAAIGHTEPGGEEPLRPDALVRASSNTKPIVAALALALVEDGVLALDEPVEHHLPELAGRRVLRRVEDPAPDAPTDPAARPITLDDLLTMRMGFGWVWDRPCPTVDAAVAAGVGLGPPDPAGLPAPDAWLARFARFPLLHQPGAAWRYDLSYAVLGVLLARAVPRPLPDLLTELLLEPLGMTDTAFRALDPERLVPAWWQGGDTDDAGGPTLLDPGGTASAWASEPAFPDARGGLVTTVDDLLRFARGLLDDGLGRGTVLSSPEVALMTRDHLTADQRADPAAAPFLDGGGWGHGVGVHPVTPLGPRYGWAGGLGTLWWSWPEHDAAAVLVTQVSPPSGPVFEAFRAAAESTLRG